MAEEGKKVLHEGELTIVTAGTPLQVPNHAAQSVAIFNNNTDGTIIAIGLQDTVDALSIPPVGRILFAGDSTVIDVLAKSSEVWVDASVSNKKVTYQILG